MLRTKLQLNKLSRSGEKVGFIGFAIFSIGGQFGFSIRLNFTSLKLCSLIMLHMKSENHGSVISENR